MNWPPKLKAKRHPTSGKWWVHGLTSLTVPRAGPYDTKAEALDDLKGLTQHFTDNEEWHKKQIRKDVNRAETWFELTYDKPCPDRDTPKHKTMFELYAKHIFEQYRQRSLV